MGLLDNVKEISELPDGRPFYLLSYDVRMKQTTYGEKERFVLRIAWQETGEAELYSGFSAGILAQLSNSDKRDFPAFVKLTTTPGSAGRSGTRKFVPADADVQESLTTDEDIPF